MTIRVAETSNPHRSSDQLRFMPYDWIKRVVQCESNDVDQIARRELETGFWIQLGSLRDRHGYPTA